MVYFYGFILILETEKMLGKFIEYR